MHYEQQQLKYAGLHFQPVFHKLFYKLPISKQNYQEVIVYQITIEILDRHLGWRSQDPTLDLSPNFVKGI